MFIKALRLNKTSLDETTVGQVVNLLANDVNRFDLGFKYMHFLWVGPLVTIVVTYFLWLEIGISSLFGVFVMLSLVPLQGCTRRNYLYLLYLYLIIHDHNVLFRVVGKENLGISIENIY